MRIILVRPLLFHGVLLGDSIRPFIHVAPQRLPGGAFIVVQAVKRERNMELYDKIRVSLSPSRNRSAWPMPRLAPVTRAILPCSVNRWIGCLRFLIGTGYPIH
jgi:hypothetical protein